jgi:hypothetical protein
MSSKRSAGEVPWRSGGIDTSPPTGSGRDFLWMVVGRKSMRRTKFVRHDGCMRFRNLSDMSLPTSLWKKLAAAFDLENVLPGAEPDDLGMYSCSTLRMTVRPRRGVGSEVVVTGTYTFGRINLRPCDHCTVGFLTQVYLHELVHAWLHQYRERQCLSEHACALAERFANAGYSELGGTYRKVELCGSYRLPLPIPDPEVMKFTSLANSLRRQAITGLFDWHPPRRRRVR